MGLKSFYKKENSTESQISSLLSRSVSMSGYAYNFFGGFSVHAFIFIHCITVISLLHLVVIYVQLKVVAIKWKDFVKGLVLNTSCIWKTTSIFYIPYITINMYIEGQVL